jgi:hypothetical protein
VKNSTSYIVLWQLRQLKYTAERRAHWIKKGCWSVEDVTHISVLLAFWSRSPTLIESSTWCGRNRNEEPYKVMKKQSGQVTQKGRNNWRLKRIRDSVPSIIFLWMERIKGCKRFELERNGPCTLLTCALRCAVEHKTGSRVKQLV